MFSAIHFDSNEKRNDFLNKNTRLSEGVTAEQLEAFGQRLLSNRTHDSRFWPSVYEVKFKENDIEQASDELVNAALTALFRDANGPQEELYFYDHGAVWALYRYGNTARADVLNALFEKATTDTANFCLKLINPRSRKQTFLNLYFEHCDNFAALEILLGKANREVIQQAVSNAENPEALQSKLETWRQQSDHPSWSVQFDTWLTSMLSEEAQTEAGDAGIELTTFRVSEERSTLTP